MVNNIDCIEHIFNAKLQLLNHLVDRWQHHILDLLV